MSSSPSVRHSGTHAAKASFSSIINGAFGKVNERKTVVTSPFTQHTQPHRLPRASQFHNVLLGKPLETSFASNLSGAFFGGRLNRLRGGWVK